MLVPVRVCEAIVGSTFGIVPDTAASCDVLGLTRRPTRLQDH